MPPWAATLSDARAPLRRGAEAAAPPLPLLLPLRRRGPADVALQIQLRRHRLVGSNAAKSATLEAEPWAVARAPCGPGAAR